MKTVDKPQIDKIVTIFFGIFTNTNNKQPDWARIDDVCIPGTLIIKKTETAEEVYNLNSFIEPRKKILTDGTLTHFEESETAEETRIIGNIAQRFSRYQKSGYLNGTYFKQHGNKLFQFIKTNEGWKISSLTWEDDQI
jgi:hypothetical protein